jgi:dihydroorotase
MKIHIRDGRLVDPRHGIDAARDLYLAAGKVVGIGAAPDGFHANRTIDAAGCVVAPGLVDLAARLREPGFEYKATLESEMLAAVAGGVTSVVCPPDTDPVLDEPGLVEMLKFRAKSLNLAHLYPLGALTAQLKGERLTEMRELADHGCVAFSQADARIVDTEVLWRALQYAATFGFSVWLRPQDPHIAKSGVAHDGEVATRLGLPAIPAAAEIIALHTILELVRMTGTRVHLARLSTRKGVELVRRAKADGLPVTCDVAVHHLHLSEMDLGYFDAHCHVVPPFRALRDRDALSEGVRDGTVDAVCSDHTPVDEDAKQLPFGESEPGTTGLELLLPLTLRWAEASRVPLAAALARITSEPARVLGLDAGHLGVGAPADVCIFEPDAHFRVTAQSLRSLGKNTPFMGYELPGVVRATLVGGAVVHERDARRERT